MWLFIVVTLGMLIVMAVVPIGIVLTIVLVVRHVDRSGRSSVGLLPPGWYPDPWHEATLRYWTGSVWTADLSPVDDAPT